MVVAIDFFPVSIFWIMGSELFLFQSLVLVPIFLSN